MKTAGEIASPFPIDAPQHEDHAAEVLEMLRYMLPYAEIELRAMQKKMCGHLYPWVIEDRIVRAHGLIDAADAATSEGK